MVSFFPDDVTRDKQGIDWENLFTKKTLTGKNLKGVLQIRVELIKVWLWW
jgi:hypothetical protein